MWFLGGPFDWTERVLTLLAGRAFENTEKAWGPLERFLGFSFGVVRASSRTRARALP